MGYLESGYERVTLEFRGSIAGTFLRYLLLGILTQLIIPTAWGTAILYRRLVGWVRFSDGSSVAFEGRPGQVWGWLALAAGIGYAPAIAVGLINNDNPILLRFDPTTLRASLDGGDPVAGAVHSALSLLIFPIILYVELMLYRWGIAGIRLGAGPSLHFTARYTSVLGWYLLTGFSLLTIVGWAWVGTAFLRWFAGRIEGAGVGFEFLGGGWGMLWRLFPLYLLTSLMVLIISIGSVIGLNLTHYWWAFPILWIIVLGLVLICIIRWLISNTVMVKETTSPGAAPAREPPPPKAKTPPQARKPPPPRAKAPTPKPKSPQSKKPPPPPAEPPPDVPFPVVVEIKSG